MHLSHTITLRRAAVLRGSAPTSSDVHARWDGTRRRLAPQRVPTTRMRRGVPLMTAAPRRAVFMGSGSRACARPERRTVIATRPGAQQSVLQLAGGWADGERDRQAFGAAAVAAAANGRRAEIIEADRNAHVRIGRTNAVRGIEPSPTELGNIGLGPGVSRLLPHQTVGAMEIAA